MMVGGGLAGQTESGGVGQQSIQDPDGHLKARVGDLEKSVGENWDFRFGPPDVTELKMSNGVVYALDESASVLRFSTEEGTIQWKTSISGARIFEIKEGSVYVGTGTNEVYSLSAEDGTEQWNTEVSGIVSELGISDNHLITGTESGSIQALNKVNGSESWIQESTQEISEFDVSARTVCSVRETGTVVAYWADTGTQRWNWQTDGGELFNLVIETSEESTYVSTSDAIYSITLADGTTEWEFEANWYKIVNNDIYAVADDGSPPEVYALSKDNGSLRWAVQVDERVTDMIEVGDMIIITSETGTITAVGKSNGNQQWETSIQSGGDLGTVWTNTNYIYFHDYSGGAGTLYALTLTGGNIRWSVRTSEPRPVRRTIFAVFSNGDIYLHNNTNDIQVYDADTGTQTSAYQTGETPYQIEVIGERLYTQTSSGAVYAFNMNNGTKVWTFEPSGTTQYPRMEISDEAIITVGDQLTALAPDDGSQLWTETKISSASILNERVYLGTEGTVKALSIDDGSEIWKTEINGYMSEVARGGETVFISSSEFDNDSKTEIVYAVSLNEGTRQWNKEITGLFSITATPGSVHISSDQEGVQSFTEDDGSQLWSTPVSGDIEDHLRVNDTIYLGTEFGQVRAFDVDGTELWTNEIDRSISEMVLSGGTLYVGGDGGVHSLAADDGIEQWKSLTSGILYPIITTNGSIYYESEETVYSLRARDGVELWSYSAESYITGLAASGRTVCLGRGNNAITVLTENILDQVSTNGQSVTQQTATPRPTPEPTDTVTPAPTRPGPPPLPSVGEIVAGIVILGGIGLAFVWEIKNALDTKDDGPGVQTDKERAEELRRKADTESLTQEEVDELGNMLEDE